MQDHYDNAAEASLFADPKVSNAQRVPRIMKDGAEPPTLLSPEDCRLRVFEELYRFDRLDLPTLAFLLSDLPWNTETLKRRLRELVRTNHVHIFYGGRDKQGKDLPAVYTLLDRGMKVLMKARGERPRRMTAPRHHNAEKIRRHDVGLSTFMVARYIWTQAQPDGLFIPHRDIVHQSLTPEVQREHRMPVSFTYKGKYYRTSIKPDYIGIFGAGGTTSNTLTEYDASSEACNPKVFTLQKPTITGKLVSYYHLMKQHKLQRYLGFDIANVEFVFETNARKENAIHAAAAILPDDQITSSFLFTVAPLLPPHTPEVYGALEWSGVATQQRLL